MVHTHVALKRPKKLEKGVSVGAFVKALTSQSFQLFFSARLSWALKKIFFFLEASKHGFFKGEEVVDGKKPGAKSREPT